MLRSLSSWYMRSRSTSGRLRKFCMALRFTKRDWEAVRGSSSLRRISDNNPWLNGKKKKTHKFWPSHICRCVWFPSSTPLPHYLFGVTSWLWCQELQSNSWGFSSRKIWWECACLPGLCLILDHSVLTLYHHCNNHWYTEMPASKVGAWEKLWSCNYHQVPPTSISGTVRTLSAWNWEHLAVLLSFKNLPSLVNLVPTFKQHGRFTSKRKKKKFGWISMWLATVFNIDVSYGKN